MNSQKDYWEKKIIKWEESAYQGKKSLTLPVIDRLAAPFRKILKKRLKVAEKLVSKHITNKVVADLGCGTGIFLINLLKYKPKKIIGVDIASSALEKANNNLRRLDIQGKAVFKYADLRKKTDILKEVDIVTGIGFIDYFDKKELRRLFKTIRGKIFLFSFPKKIISLRELLHRVYLLIASCPGSFKYSEKEMDEIIRKAGFKKWHYYDVENIRFVTNIKIWRKPSGKTKKY